MTEEVTLSAVPFLSPGPVQATPSFSTGEGQNYIQSVNDLSKYAPVPPPDIVRRDEAGPLWERPSNQGSIAIQRRAAPYNSSPIWPPSYQSPRISLAVHITGGRAANNCTG